MRHVVAAAPLIVGGALVVPAGALSSRRSPAPGAFSQDPLARDRIEQLAMEAVIRAEEAMGHSPRDVSAQKLGWDITSHPPVVDGRMPEARLIEVKGRAKGAPTVTVTKNEIHTALNKPDQFLLAIVIVDEEGRVEGPYYLARPFTQAPDWNEEARSISLEALLGRQTTR